MAKSEGNFFSILGSIFTWVKWIFSFAVVACVLVFIKEFYPIAKDCWTCSVFESLYDAFSAISMQTFAYFQDKIVVIVSACLALWCVYEMYKAFTPTLNLLYPDAPKINDDFFQKIYKKMFLTIAILGLFIFNEPRKIFANTFEITLDFGSGIGREFIRKKINPDEIPSECKNMQSELVYKDGMSFSENTKNNMICLLKEVNILRQDFTDIGITLVEENKDNLTTTVSVAIATKVIGVVIGVVGGIVGKKALKNFISKRLDLDNLIKKTDNRIKEMTQKLDDIVDPSDRKKMEIEIKKSADYKKELEESMKKLEKKEKGTYVATNTAKTVQKTSSLFAIATAIISFFTQEEVRLGIAGLCLVIGFIILNMFFSFIIVEHMLFLGVSIILLPIIAACYIFEQTRSFATVGIKKTFGFAIGLIFMCIGMVICSEVNDFVLGGMFSAPNSSNITSAKYAISLLKSGNMEEFSKLISSGWFFIYVLFTLGFDYLILKETLNLAGDFKGNISDSKLLQPLLKIGTSSLKVVKSVSREVNNYISYGGMDLKDRGAYIDELLKRRKIKKAKKEAEENNETN